MATYRRRKTTRRKLKKNRTSRSPSYNKKRSTRRRMLSRGGFWEKADIDAIVSEQKRAELAKHLKNDSNFNEEVERQIKAESIRKGFRF